MHNTRKRSSLPVSPLTGRTAKLTKKDPKEYLPFLRELRALSNKCLADPASETNLSYHLAHRKQKLIDRMRVSVQVGSISAKTGKWVHVARENITVVDESALDQDWRKLPLPQTKYLQFHFWDPPPAAALSTAQTRAPVATTFPSAM